MEEDTAKDITASDVSSTPICSTSTRVHTHTHTHSAHGPQQAGRGQDKGETRLMNCARRVNKAAWLGSADLRFRASHDSCVSRTRSSVCSLFVLPHLLDLEAEAGGGENGEEGVEVRLPKVVEEAGQADHRHNAKVALP
eukprot:1195116-Prorocentrum_minimum.AAC.4